MVDRRKKMASTGPTEKTNPSSRRIDLASSLEIAEIINREDQKIALAVKSRLKEVARAIDLAYETIYRGGRIFYVGAGTSGRLGVLDAAECPPTFGVSPSVVQGIIAGGKKALWRSAEGAEDDSRAGIKAISKAGVKANDLVCGISASGRTPYVRGALTEAKRRRAGRILIACHPQPEIGPLADVVINPAVGSEVIAGSTRMKAGTATKMVLNMISSGVMIRLGKVYGNLMVDVKPASKKLKKRAERIIAAVLRCSEGRARNLLRLSRSQTKVAIIMGAKGCSVQEAQKLFRGGKGLLRKIL